MSQVDADERLHISCNGWRPGDVIVGSMVDRWNESSSLCANLRSSLFNGWSRKILLAPLVRNGTVWQFRSSHSGYYGPVVIRAYGKRMGALEHLSVTPTQLALATKKQRTYAKDVARRRIYNSMLSHSSKSIFDWMRTHPVACPSSQYLPAAAAHQEAATRNDDRSLERR